MPDEINQKAFAIAISNGDKAAYERVFRFYYSSLSNYAYSLLKDRHRAEDVVQTIFLRIWNQRREQTLPVYLKNYLYRSVHNEAINILRHKKVIQDSSDFIEDLYEEWNDSSVGDSQKNKEQRKRLKKGIDGLPPRTREVFVLSRYNGLTYKEVAQVMNISPKTVENQMGRALRKLREYLICLYPVLLSLYLYLYT